MILKTKIAFLDFETTGINIFNSDPIEIGVLLINEKFEIIKTFDSFIRPHIKSKMRASSFKTHGHQIDTLLNKPPDKEVLTFFFQEFGTNYCFGGWNISFDIPFFRKMCHRSGMMKEFNSINYRHIDVQSIARVATELELLPKDINSLNDIIDYFSLRRSEKHSAIEDAKITFEVFKHLMGLFKQVCSNRNLKFVSGF